MRFQLKETSDGSLTVFDQEAGEFYKSQHAAKTESELVFVRPGILENIWWQKADPFRVLELGFGLGTNFSHLVEKNLAVEFTSIEKDLSGADFFIQTEAAPAALKKIFAGEKKFGQVQAKIIEGDFFKILPELKGPYHAIFFDPFSPKANPMAWTHSLFSLCFQLLAPGGRLVTYSVSRIAKDAAVAAGFEIHKHNTKSTLRKRSALLATKPAKP